MSERFDYSRDYSKLDFRAQPELYQVGVGEQGVLLVEPYKSEILPHWRFATPDLALQSADRILELFREYRDAGDFPGMDMARKFLQMGMTRSRRYANHRTGKKYRGPVPPGQKGRSGAHGRAQLPLDPDQVKAECAEIFRQTWQRVKNDPVYQAALERAKSAASRESLPGSAKRAPSESNSVRPRRAHRG